MTRPDALSFPDLAEARRLLNEDVRRHRDSVNFFASDTGFHRTAADVDLNLHQPPDIQQLDPEQPLSGVTTAATCFESLATALLDVESREPSRFAGLSEGDRARLDAFAASAFPRTVDWRSEGAARRYCIVRAAAPLVRLCPQGDTAAVEEAVGWVWAHVTPVEGREAIYEVARLSDDEGGGDPDHWAIDDDDRRRYPPNAFLTFWGLASLGSLPALVAEYGDQASRARLWLRQVVGRECAYVSDDSQHCDPQQLAWAIAGVIATEESQLSDRPTETLVLIRAGMRALFQQQRHDGTWDTGRALFHYPEAGNAYCYIYETLAELVGLAVDQSRPFQREVRELLSPYLPNLLLARDALNASGRQLGDRRGVGWSSGHHPHRTSPESWATATAYRFLQNLRRLVGVEVRDLAAKRLHARQPRRSRSDLARFGSSWDAGRGSAGDLLGALFVNPSAAHPTASAAYDPDRPQLAQEWARSALMFGPPGTGKTTLAEAVAGALRWEFVEVTPAEFLDRGMELVSARADEIFRQLMELDRAVVLFDEIDELVRRRDGGAPPADIVGRFFTTTMLPRLARLWSARRLIFFANTNSLGSVDSAVTRSQRFDATILVMPPSMRTKMQALGPAAGHIDPDAIAELLANVEANPDPADPGKKRVGWLPFLRFDQLARLSAVDFAGVNELLALIERLGVEVAADWVLEVADDDDADALRRKLVHEYQAEVRRQRIDLARLRLVEVPDGAAVPVGEVLTVDDAYAAGYAVWMGESTPGDVMDGAGRLRPG